MPISLYEMWEKIGHGMFGPKLIKKEEYEILKTLEWDINLITPFHFNSYFIQAMRNSKVGSDEDPESMLIDSIDEKKRATTITDLSYDGDFMKELFDSLEIVSTQFCKMSIINEKLLNYKPSEISLASIFNSVAYIKDTGYSCQKSNKISWIHNSEMECRNWQSYSFNYSWQEQERMDKVERLLDSLLSKDFWNKSNILKCAEELREYMKTFEEVYPECHNIMKFSLIEK